MVDPVLAIAMWISWIPDKYLRRASKELCNFVSSFICKWGVFRGRQCGGIHSDTKWGLSEQWIKVEEGVVTTSD